MSEHIFTICVAVVTVVFIGAFTWMITNHNNNYLRTVEMCLAAQHTWIPTHKGGVCLAPTMTIQNNMNPTRGGVQL
jgi:hypothetical protein